MPKVMVHVYLCFPWLPFCICLCPPGFHYPLYGKTAGREESEVTPPSRGGVVSSKQSGDSSSSSAMELLQQQSHQYHGKSPAVRHRSLHCHIHPSAHSVTHLTFVTQHGSDVSWSDIPACKSYRLDTWHITDAISLNHTSIKDDLFGIEHTSHTQQINY